MRTSQLSIDQVAGMDMLVGVLKSFENMTDADIEAAIKDLMPAEQRFNVRRGCP